MKYYYDDPIKAAWMAREFGVMFDDIIENREMCLTECHGKDKIGKIQSYTIKRKFKISILFRDIKNNHIGKYYIHPDCHEMLKPQVGDLCKWDVFGWCKAAEILEIDNGIIHLDEYGVANDDIIIIQRNGKAFFMPEVEE